MKTLSILFSWLAVQSGKPLVIIAVAALIILWKYSGFADEQLNLLISIYTMFLGMMLLGRQTLMEAEDRRREKAQQAKQDELIRATTGARNEMMGIEDRLGEKDIDKVRPKS